MKNMAINGLGRIGKLVVRRLFDVGLGTNLTQLNDLNSDSGMLAHLLEFDTVHGKWQKTVRWEDEKIVIEILNQFSKNFQQSLQKHFCWRMGIEEIDSKNLNEIMVIILNESEKNKIDFANMFYDFYGGKNSILDCIKTNYGKKYKINEFSKVVEILKESYPSKGALEKKHELDNNRQNLL